LDEFRRANDERRKRERAEFEDRDSITEGLVAYPAAGMEPIFRAWLERGYLDGHAITVLYHLNTAAARQVLAQLAESPAKPDDSAHQSHRLAAVYSLARMDDKSYVPLLERLAHDDNSSVRQQAILGLGMLGGEKELPFLTTLAREGATMSDRQNAIMSMGDTSSLKAIPILIDLIVLPDSDRPSASTVALPRLTHHYLPIVDRRSLLETQAAWQDWWKQNQRTARVYGPFEGSNGNAEPAVKK
jgi:HEAT repeat protein